MQNPPVMLLMMLGMILLWFAEVRVARKEQRRPRTWILFVIIAYVMVEAAVFISKL